VTVGLAVVIVMARKLDAAAGSELAEPVVVTLPHRPAAGNDRVGVGELRVQESRNELAWQV
jgi:hypothetical protein